MERWAWTWHGCEVEELGRDGLVPYLRLNVNVNDWGR